MGDWSNIIQSLVWPVLIGSVLVWLRVPVVRVITAVAARIERGDPLDLPGVKLGPSSIPVVPPPGTAGFAGSSVSEMLAEKTTKPDYYLIHSSKRNRSLDRGRQAYYDVNVWLDADQADMLDRVASVTYLLHSSFKNPVRVIMDRESGFTLKTSAWGEFNLHAEIKFKNSTEVRVLERYLNL